MPNGGCEVETAVGVIVGTVLNIGTTVSAVFAGILAVCAAFLALSYIAGAILFAGRLVAWAAGHVRGLPAAAQRRR